MVRLQEKHHENDFLPRCREGDWLLIENYFDWPEKPEVWALPHFCWLLVHNSPNGRQVKRQHPLFQL
jgi:hypothetical protein